MFFEVETDKLLRAVANQATYAARRPEGGNCLYAQASGFDAVRDEF